MVSEDFRKQVSGYGLTTAHILYRRPDHRWLLQSYVWQNYDLFPEFPELHRFLAFWKEKLEGPLHSVRVAHCKLIKPAELRTINREFRLHETSAGGQGAAKARVANAAPLVRMRGRAQLTGECSGAYSL